MSSSTLGVAFRDLVQAAQGQAQGEVAREMFSPRSRWPLPAGLGERFREVLSKRTKGEQLAELDRVAEEMRAGAGDVQGG